jgi:hypothetical protein
MKREMKLGKKSHLRMFYPRVFLLLSLTVMISTGAAVTNAKGLGLSCQDIEKSLRVGFLDRVLARGMLGPSLRLRGGSSWGTWGSPSQSFTKKAYNPEQDPEAEMPPDDGVTALSFSPPALAPKTYLVATSWDSSVRCWDVDTSTGKASPVGMQRHEKPAMCCGWRGDGGAILSGGADGKGMSWEISTGQWTQIAQHDGPIVGIIYSELPSPCVITGSWDKTVKFWDARCAHACIQMLSDNNPWFLLCSWHRCA